MSKDAEMEVKCLQEASSEEMDMAYFGGGIPIEMDSLEGTLGMPGRARGATEAIEGGPSVPFACCCCADPTLACTLDSALAAALALMLSWPCVDAVAKLLLGCAAAAEAVSEKGDGGTAAWPAEGLPTPTEVSP